METSTHGLRLSDLSGRELGGIAWSLAWRGVAINIAGAIVGAIAGFLAVVVWQLVRELFGISLSPEAAMSSARIVGACAGFAFAVPLNIVYLFWLLKSRIGVFRLQLVRVPSDL
jgi:hypothetical protein